MPTRLIRKRCAVQNTRCHAMLDIEQRVNCHPSNHPATAISSANPSHPRLLAFLPASSVANLPRTQKKTHPSATHQQPAATRRAPTQIKPSQAATKTHLKHSSNLHRRPSSPPPTPAPPPVPPPAAPKPGLYGAPGNNRRLSAYIIPATNASCAPTSSHAPSSSREFAADRASPARCCWCGACAAPWLEPAISVPCESASESTSESPSPSPCSRAPRRRLSCP